MANYIDGFSLPIPRDRLDEYKRSVEAVAEIWKEYGALRYQEYIGDDMRLEGTRSFIDVMGASDEEVIVFGWVEFASREARDEANEKLMNDPRMADLVDPAQTGFDAERMAFGGFRPLVT